MAIEIYCDGKNCRSKDMDTFYCVDCYTELEGQLQKAEVRITELEDQLNKQEA